MRMRGHEFSLPPSSHKSYRDEGMRESLRGVCVLLRFHHFPGVLFDHLIL